MPESIILFVVVAFIFLLSLSAAMVDFLETPDTPPATPDDTERTYLEYPTVYRDAVKKASQKYGIEEERIYAVIRVESNFKEKCVSRADARGLMQMLPSTYKGVCEKLGRKYDENDLFDPEINIDVCTYYMKYIYDKFGDWDHAHAAYNAGYVRVQGWLKDDKYSKNGKLIIENIPIVETRNYVNKVNYYYNEYKLAKAHS